MNQNQCHTFNLKSFGLVHEGIFKSNIFSAPDALRTFFKNLKIQNKQTFSSRTTIL